MCGDCSRYLSECLKKETFRMIGIRSTQVKNSSEEITRKSGNRLHATFHSRTIEKQLWKADAQKTSGDLKLSVRKEW